MSMFASKTPEQAGFTPHPWRYYFSGLSLPAEAVLDWDNSHAHVYLDVENQWYGLQSNPVNDRLTAVRECTNPAHTSVLDCINMELYWFNTRWAQARRDSWSPEDEHAYRVWTKFKAVYC
jgi:hypothetical protein